MIRIVLILLGIAALGYATFRYTNRESDEGASPYRFVTVEQGDVEMVVASTGTLNPITTVPVGTQVSGIVSAIYVDYNDNVRHGQVVARIDTTLLASTVQDAQANLERNEAQLRQAQREFARIEPLYQKQFVTEVEYNLARYNLDIAMASTKSARISLQRAQRNLGYATIHAPISGTVIERNVNVGQTVAANFAAPQLFLIGQDLSEMEILASVDESDIGMIEPEQTARFTVQAYPEETFTGIVHQVRLQSTTLENVVNYTVSVDVDNPDGRLLPGMTATVEFLIETAENVLKVPNTALRFRPTESMMAEVRAPRGAQRQTPGDSVRGHSNRPGADGASQPISDANRGADHSGRRQNMTMLWYLDETGTLTIEPVRTGISDGTMTGIVSDRLEPGMKIIAGVTQDAAGNQSSSPFQQSSTRRRFPGSF